MAYKVFDYDSFNLINGTVHVEKGRRRYQTLKCKPAIGCNPYTQKLFHQYHGSDCPNTKYWLLKRAKMPSAYDMGVWL